MSIANRQPQNFQIWNGRAIIIQHGGYDGPPDGISPHRLDGPTDGPGSTLCQQVFAEGPGVCHHDRSQHLLGVLGNAEDRLVQTLDHPDERGQVTAHDDRRPTKPGVYHVGHHPIEPPVVVVFLEGHDPEAQQRDVLDGNGATPQLRPCPVLGVGAGDGQAGAGVMGDVVCE